jgi:Putative transposase/Transposase zinc-binding domain
VRAHAADYRRARGGTLTSREAKALIDLAACRTAALGGHVQQCDSCGYRQVSYNSCRNRHCPQCQGSQQAAWFAARSAELLPVPYFHLVFTLPHELAPLALVNPRVVYGLLFRTASETLQQLAADPRHLGAQIGGLFVLHTWGQNLEHHPHVHGIVPGGGISPDGRRWVPSRPNFFLPVKVLSRLFRGKFLAGLRAAHARGELVFPGRLAPLAAPHPWNALCRSLSQKEWVVYSKPPFGGPSQVLKYLARYTHRVAFSNDRLLRLKDGRVTFSWKNYAAGGKRQRMTLSAVEFLRRFLLHVLPKGFVRIRRCGWWTNCHGGQQLARCRELLGVAAPVVEPPLPAVAAIPVAVPEPAPRCSQCGKGTWLPVEVTARPSRGELVQRLQLWDTS